MSWKIRHQGSPKHLAGLTVEEVVQGLLDGQWEPTDEVMGPNDTEWVPIETHPQYEEVALELEPPPPKHHEDESKLDMNALIDVCLVLLIFFILIGTYAAVQKMLESPDLTADSDRGVKVVHQDEADKTMVIVKVRQGEISVEDKRVEQVDKLVPMLRAFVREKHKTELVIDHDRATPHGTIVAIEDAAKIAGMSKVHILVPKEELTQ
jgi:biopolymer transport protein ExbD